MAAQKQGKPKQVRCSKREAKPKERIVPMNGSYRFASARAAICWETTQRLRDGETTHVELSQDIMAHVVLMAEFITNNNEAAAEEIRGLIAGIIRAVAWHFNTSAREAAMMMPATRAIAQETYLQVA